MKIIKLKSALAVGDSVVFDVIGSVDLLFSNKYTPI